jgi:hypothetical protein
VRVVELHRERVVLRRALCGIKMAVNLPVAAYRGVLIRMEPTTANAPGAIAVVLEHPDPALSLTLCRAADGSDMVAEWQCWGRALGIPLLVEEPDGSLREPFEHIGGVRVGIPISRRRRPQHAQCPAAIEAAAARRWRVTPVAECPSRRARDHRA